MVPCRPSPPVVPFTCHVAAAAEPFTVALNICVEPAGMAAAAGLISTPCAAVMFRVAVPVRPPVADVAVTVTLAGVVGAVKTPALVMLPPPLALQVNVEPG